MKLTYEKMEDLQVKLEGKIPEKYQGVLADIINLEYRLTMAGEGHTSELELAGSDYKRMNT